MANEKQQGGLMFNALTAGSKIVGNITADSDFRIDGLIEGELNCTGKVVIGEAGRVKGRDIGSDGRQDHVSPAVVASRER